MNDRARNDTGIGDAAGHERWCLEVRGRVQGVGYRAACLRRARALGLAGWVRNRPDGAVELEAEGPPPRLADLQAWCAEGPPLARVVEVRRRPVAPLGPERPDFEIRR